MLLSIVIPIYNVENYLDECLQSILNQIDGESKVEILLIDDGSADRSAEICDSYAIEYSFIKVFHTRNGGQGSARNYGISRSRGKYVYFLDADDLLENDFFQKVWDELQKDVDIIIAKKDTIYNCLTGEYRSKIIEILAENQSVEDKVFHFFLNTSRLGCAIYNSRNIKSNCLHFSEKRDFCEDDTFLFFYLQKCASIKIIDTAFYCYREKRIGSIVNTFNQETIIPTLQETNRVVEKIKTLTCNYKEDLFSKYGYRLLDYYIKYPHVKNKKIKKYIVKDFKSKIWILKKSKGRLKYLLVLRHFIGVPLTLRVMCFVRNIYEH